MGNAVALPKFDGSDALTAENFDSIVRAKSIEHGWNEEETAGHAINAFDGPVLSWLEKEAKTNVLIRRDWKRLREAFLKKYKKGGNLDQEIAGLYLETKIPSFSGINTKKWTVQKFILSVENMATLRSWDNQETYKNAISSLTEKAAKDIQSTTDLNNQWDNLKKRLLELYGPHMSLDERVKILKRLHQKGSESSDEFFARINSDMLAFEDDILKSAGSTAEHEAMMKMHKLYSALLFAQGINLNVRDRLLKMPVATGKDKIPSLDEITSTAKTMEQYERVEKAQNAILDKIKKDNTSTGQQPEKFKKKDSRHQQQFPEKKFYPRQARQRPSQSEDFGPQSSAFGSGFSMPNAGPMGNNFGYQPRPQHFPGGKNPNFNPRRERDVYHSSHFSCPPPPPYEENQKKE